jgi:hypothetical protein
MVYKIFAKIFRNGHLDAAPKLPKNLHKRIPRWCTKPSQNLEWSDQSNNIWRPLPSEKLSRRCQLKMSAWTWYHVAPAWTGVTENDDTFSETSVRASATRYQVQEEIFKWSIVYVVSLWRMPPSSPKTIRDHVFRFIMQVPFKVTKQKLDTSN